MIYLFHEAKANLHSGRDKMNCVIIHLHGYWHYRLCASILHHKIGGSGLLTQKNVTAFLSSVNFYKHCKVLVFRLSRFLRNYNLTWKFPIKVVKFPNCTSHVSTKHTIASRVVFKAPPLQSGSGINFDQQ